MRRRKLRKRKNDRKIASLYTNMVTYCLISYRLSDLGRQNKASPFCPPDGKKKLISIEFDRHKKKLFKAA